MRLKPSEWPYNELLHHIRRSRWLFSAEQPPKTQTQRPETSRPRPWPVIYECTGGIGLEFSNLRWPEDLCLYFESWSRRRLDGRFFFRRRPTPFCARKDRQSAITGVNCGHMSHRAPQLVYVPFRRPSQAEPRSLQHWRRPRAESTGLDNDGDFCPAIGYAGERNDSTEILCVPTTT